MCARAAFGDHVPIPRFPPLSEEAVAPAAPILPLVMSTEISPSDRFRRGFVLGLTIAYAIAFFAMISGLFEPLLLAAIFSGIVHPLYRWLHGLLGGRSTLASLMSILVVLLAILVPLIVLLGLVAEQAVQIAQQASPWVERQLAEPSLGGAELPAWMPFSAELEPYREEITAKLAELTGNVGVFLGGSLARLSEGTAVFFFQLFVMLYSMFFFLTSGPALLDKILDYVPLTQADRAKMKAVGLSVSRATVKGTLVIGVAQGTLGGLGFAAAGIDAAVFWGAIMAVMSILPGIGAALY